MQGKIIKGIAGFYYVHVVESGVYECKAKGIFRKDGVKPLVGDNVEIEILDEQEKTGNIYKVYGVSNCGMPQEQVYYGLDELENAKGYLTTVIVKTCTE